MEIAEKAQSIYQQAKADRRLRTLLSTHLPPASDAPLFPNGLKVAYYQETVGAREPNYRGPASVLGFHDGKYILTEANRYFFADRAHVRPWPDQVGDLPTVTNPEQPAPTSRDCAPDEELKLTGSHPQDRVDPPASPGPDLRPIIHDERLVEKPSDELATKLNPNGRVTCGRCNKTNQKHAHKREPGCLLYDPTDPNSWSPLLKAAHEAKKLRNRASESQPSQSQGGEQKGIDGLPPFQNIDEVRQYQQKLLDSIGVENGNKNNLSKKKRINWENQLQALAI